LTVDVVWIGNNRRRLLWSVSGQRGYQEQSTVRSLGAFSNTSRHI